MEASHPNDTARLTENINYVPKSSLTDKDLNATVDRATNPGFKMQFGSISGIDDRSQGDISRVTGLMHSPARVHGLSQDHGNDSNLLLYL